MWICTLASLLWTQTTISTIYMNLGTVQSESNSILESVLFWGSKKRLRPKKKKCLFPITRPSQKNSADSTKFFSNFRKKIFIWVIFGDAMLPAKNKMAAARSGTSPRRSITIFSLGNQHIFVKRSESCRLNGERSFSTRFLWKKRSFVDRIRIWKVSYTISEIDYVIVRGNGHTEK